MAVDWIGKSAEGPVTDIYVGLTSEEAQRAARATGVELIRLMVPGGNYTFDHRANRLNLYLVDGVVT